MHPQIKIIGELPDGSLRAIAVDENGFLRIAGGTETSGGGDASAANQLLAIENIGNKSDTAIKNLRIVYHAVQFLFRPRESAPSCPQA